MYFFAKSPLLPHAKLTLYFNMAGSVEKAFHSFLSVTKVETPEKQTRKASSVWKYSCINAQSQQGQRE